MSLTYAVVYTELLDLCAFDRMSQVARNKQWRETQPKLQHLYAHDVFWV
jgi:hypothetical protein